MSNDNKVVEFPNASATEMAWSKFEHGEAHSDDVLKAMIQEGFEKGTIPVVDGYAAFHDVIKHLAERLNADTDGEAEYLIFDEEGLLSDEVFPFVAQMTMGCMLDVQAFPVEDDSEGVDMDEIRRIRAKQLWEIDSAKLPRTMPNLV